MKINFNLPRKLIFFLNKSNIRGFHSKGFLLVTLQIGGKLS